jgi:hypothetical protein
VKLCSPLWIEGLNSISFVMSIRAVDKEG